MQLLNYDDSAAGGMGNGAGNMGNGAGWSLQDLLRNILPKLFGAFGGGGNTAAPGGMGQRPPGLMPLPPAVPGMQPPQLQGGPAPQLDASGTPIATPPVPQPMDVIDPATGRVRPRRGSQRNISSIFGAPAQGPATQQSGSSGGNQMVPMSDLLKRGAMSRRMVPGMQPGTGGTLPIMTPPARQQF